MVLVSDIVLLVLSSSAIISPFADPEGLGEPSPNPFYKYLSETKLFHFHGIFNKKNEIKSAMRPNTFICVYSLNYGFGSVLFHFPHEANNIYTHMRTVHSAVQQYPVTNSNTSPPGSGANK